MQESLTQPECLFWRDIIYDLKRLLETKEGYDVIIYVGEAPNIRKFFAHSLILECRSQYFLMLFSENLVEKKNNCFILRRPNISSSCTFHHILSYLYCGDIDLKRCTVEEILSIIITASDFYLDKLVQHSKEYLHANLQDILRNGNPLECLMLSFSHESLFYLQDIFVQLICQEPKSIFGTRYFYYLPSNLLEMLIKREDLLLDQITIWENLVKWCIYQRKNFKNEEKAEDFIRNLNQEEINDIKKYLEKYINLIDFKKITAQEYINKVMPYEELLSKELKKEILRPHMSVIENSENELESKSTKSIRPLSCCGSINIITSFRPKKKFSVQKKLDSKLINHLHIALFAAWIDKKPETKTEINNNCKLINYEFNLLFRSTRDGIYGKSFHEKCDNKGSTIIVAKIKNSKRLIGGYNPLGWEGNCIKSTTDSFLFAINELDISTRKIGRVINPQDAIRCFKDWGPIFGDLNGDSNDLVMTNLGYWSSNSGSYENIGIPNQFKVDEWEVFQVKKRKNIKMQE